MSIALDPNHIIAELLFTIVFDGLVVALLWGIVFKRMILPRLRRDIHKEIDSQPNTANPQANTLREKS